ncbi:hypothetical protein HK099_008610 [Clydaea vesicula]|uniref:Uncharacterized protein n=1 Tax=Clydaea vesicula TaxID=447962 RepID=A0AAD5TV96_9FUNG|nr:hypothetical protein HK099_008610 [Clydaea vesicula]
METNLKRDISSTELETDNNSKKLATIDDFDDEYFQLQENKRTKRNQKNTVHSEIYLDTINRNLLDFDFEKVCSVNLQTQNIYSCLVCGKYFQGRGPKSHAYYHSLHQDHHVFINLTDLHVYVLPDDYLVEEKSLNDIKNVLNPTFTEEDIKNIEESYKNVKNFSQISFSYDLTKKSYIPGYIGLNNVKANDYINEISSASKKKFIMLKQNDPIEFLSWFLNSLHTSLVQGPKKGKTSIIHDLFRGELKIESQHIVDSTSNSAPQTTDNENTENKKLFDLTKEVQVKVSPFMFLTLDLPPPPLFLDDLDKNMIPQVDLTTLLKKYNGETEQEVEGVIKRYKITKLPKYLILNVKRFIKAFKLPVTKNPTIVNFDLTLDMSEYGGGIYDLVANASHEGKSEGNYKVQLKLGLIWIQIQDLIVEEILKEMICLTETYIQVWQLREN